MRRKQERFWSVNDRHGPQATPHSFASDVAVGTEFWIFTVSQNLK